MQGLGDLKNLSFNEAKREALRRLNAPQYLAKQQQARQISHEAQNIAGENSVTRNYVEERLGQELKGRSNLLNDRDALNNQVIDPIRQRIAEVSSQTKDELLDEIDTLDRQLGQYEQELRDLENRTRLGGELDAFQQQRFDKLKNDIIPQFETEIDYLEQVRQSKLRPQQPQSPKPTVNATETKFSRNATPEEVLTWLTQGNDSGSCGIMG